MIQLGIGYVEEGPHESEGLSRLGKPGLSAGLDLSRFQSRGNLQTIPVGLHVEPVSEMKTFLPYYMVILTSWACWNQAGERLIFPGCGSQVPPSLKNCGSERHPLASGDNDPAKESLALQAAFQITSYNAFNSILCISGILDWNHTCLIFDKAPGRYHTRILPWRSTTIAGSLIGRSLYSSFTG